MRHETVGKHLVGSIGRARADETVAGALARLAAEKPSSVELICVTDHAGRLLGALSIARLFALEGGVPLREAMDPAFPRIGPDEDQETAASLALHHGVDALPVVDREGGLLGVMPAQALLQVLRREHVEDLHVLSGIRRETSKARHAIEDPPMRSARHRLPWLLVGLAGGALATATMAAFEATLEKTVAVAFFVPALVYLADAVGTQTEAIAVRGLSLTRTGIGRLLSVELRTGMLIGVTLGALAFLPIWLAFGNVRLAAAVSTSIFVAGSIAAAIGLGLPWWLARRGLDPAYGSGPVATVIQDILSILVYFAVLRAFGI
ncbi:MAG: magnesium transporter [Betaproteobacteria bacterium]|nr:magnesium transporter [Betaproteobacteria bacterium]